MSDEIERTDAGTPMLDFSTSMEGKTKETEREIKPPQTSGPMLDFGKSGLQMESIRLGRQIQAEKEQKIKDKFFHEQENIRLYGPLDKLNEEVIPEDEQEISELATRGDFTAIEQQISQELTNLNADPRATEFLSLCREMGGSGDPEVHAIIGQLTL